MINTRMPHLHSRRCKIIATLGPASADAETITKLIHAGVGACRLNMSHGDHASHREVYQRVREAASALGKPIAVFADLCGPKIRAGNFTNGSITLMDGTSVTVTVRDVLGQEGLIPCQYRSLAKDVVIGDRILLDDANLELRVEAVAGEDIACSVIRGGILKNHKGINLPGVAVSSPSLTEKDHADALFAMDLGVDYLALSFVRRAEDILELREIIRNNGCDTGIIAKIEKPEALENSQDIIDAADAIMVARGDLGVELSPEEVPVAQYQLIRMARAQNKPVIIATQMLESMTINALPTRAEATDVSNAVYSAADAVMLSGESASGAHPVLAVEMMARIIAQTEAFMWQQDHFGKLMRRDNKADIPLPFGDAVANAAARLCHDLDAKAIVIITSGGQSAVTLSSARPAAPLLALSGNAHVCRRMNLYWGIIPLHCEAAGHANPNILARQYASALGLAVPGECIVLMRGFHADPHINSPTISMLTM